MRRSVDIIATIDCRFSKDRFWAETYIYVAKLVVDQCAAAGTSFAAFRESLIEWISTQDDEIRRRAGGLLAFVNSPAWPSVARVVG